MSLVSYSSFVLPFILFIYYFWTPSSFDYTCICNNVYTSCTYKTTTQHEALWSVLSFTYIYVIHSLQALIYVLTQNSLNRDSLREFTNVLHLFS